MKVLAVAAILIIVIILMVSGCTRNTDEAPASTRNNTTFKNITSIDDSNYNDSYGLSSSQKFAAISIAMNNGTVKSYIDSYSSRKNRSIKSVTPMNVTSWPEIKTTFYEEGFLNLSTSVVTVPIVTGEAPAVDFYNVFVDLTHEQVIGEEKYYLKAQPVVNVLIPQGASWYHQLTGTETVMPGNYTSVKFRVSAASDDMTALYLNIFGKNVFENFNNGSSYPPFEWTDAVTTDKHVIDGSKAIEPQYTDNGTSTWMFNMNLSHSESLETKYFSPTYYYVIIQNKANKSIPINFYVTF